MVRPSTAERPRTVRQIRAALAAREPAASIWRRSGLSPNAFWDRWVRALDKPNQAPHKRRRGSDHHSARLSECSVAELRDLRIEGARYAELAARFGVSVPTAWAAAVGRSWRLVAATPAKYRDRSGRHS